jgi:hypothetical protein
MGSFNVQRSCSTGKRYHEPFAPGLTRWKRRQRRLKCWAPERLAGHYSVETAYGFVKDNFHHKRGRWKEGLWLMMADKETGIHLFTLYSMAIVVGNLW